MQPILGYFITSDKMAVKKEIFFVSTRINLKWPSGEMAYAAENLKKEESALVRND